MRMSHIKNNCKETHKCYCGTARPAPHSIGSNGCTRLMTKTPTWIGGGGWHEWEVSGHTLSAYCLKHQRGYFKHDCGCWSRAAESSNSLPDET